MADNVVAIRRNYDTAARSEAAKAGKQRRLTPRARQAVDLLMTDPSLTQKAAAERVGMAPESLARILKTPQASEYIEQSTPRLLRRLRMRSLARLGWLLDNAQSEHVMKDTAISLLGMDGLATSSKTGVSVTINNTPGYVLDLSDKPQTIDVTPSTDEGSEG